MGRGVAVGRGVGVGEGVPGPTVGCRVGVGTPGRSVAVGSGGMFELVVLRSTVTFWPSPFTSTTSTSRF